MKTSKHIDAIILIQRAAVHANQEAGETSAALLVADVASRRHTGLLVRALARFAADAYEAADDVPSDVRDAELCTLLDAVQSHLTMASDLLCGVGAL